MTSLREVVSSNWGNFVSTAQPFITKWGTKGAEFCTRGVNFANSLDTNGKAKYAFYKSVRNVWLNEAAVRSLYSRISQYAFKDHPRIFWGTAAGLTFFVRLFWPDSKSNSNI